MSDPDLPPQPSYNHNGATPERSALPRLIWILLILFLAWMAPTFVERIEYARTRGKERAEAEAAGKELPTDYLKELSRAFGLIAKRIGPSVVHVNTTRTLNGNGMPDELAALFGRQMVERGEGSGVIVDQQGYILTNNHVVNNAGAIQVRLSDGRTLDGDVVGTDPATDLAVIKIDADNLVAAEWGDSDALEDGSLVWAIGNPFGLDRSITFGIVSAKNRRGFENNPYQDFLQTDAAVNPGNSGGPLVDIHGHLVGINTAIIGKAYQGISFAIPSATAHEVYDKLKSEGKVARAWLGVGLGEATPDLARKFGLPSTKGALVQEVRPGSPADKAGIEMGDFIIEWNGQPIDNPGTLSLLIAKTEIGSKAKAAFIREGKKLTLDVVVEERPKQHGR